MNKWIKFGTVTTLVAFVFFFYGPEAFAKGETKLYTGTKEMITEIRKWLIALVPLAGGAAILFQLVKKKVSDGDPGTIAQCNKRISQILVGIVLGTCVVGLIAWIQTYYSGT